MLSAMLPPSGDGWTSYKWFHANDCPWDAQRCRLAADYGHLDVLKWLHAKHCPWDAVLLAVQPPCLVICVSSSG